MAGGENTSQARLFLFVTESNDNAEPVKQFIQLATQGGLLVGQILQAREPDLKPSPMAMRDCPHAPEDIYGFTEFKDTANPDGYPPSGAGYALDRSWEQSALDHYGHWYRFLEGEMMANANNLTHLITWGSGMLGYKAAILAAEDVRTARFPNGLPVSVLEDGWFPAYPGSSTFVVTPGRAYYEASPPEWGQVPPEDAFQPRRWAQYKTWWMKSRMTKYSLTPKHGAFGNDQHMPMGPDFANSSRVVWFGQVRGDAAQYWRYSNERMEQGISDCIAAGGWLKESPYTANNYELQKRFDHRIIPPALNIHAVLPHVSVACGMTSNVLLESMMWNKPVACYGSPFYAETGLVNTDLASAMESPLCDDLARNRYLDFLVHDVQFGANDSHAFGTKLLEHHAAHGEGVANAEAAG